MPSNKNLVLVVYLTCSFLGFCSLTVAVFMVLGKYSEIFQLFEGKNCTSRVHQLIACNFNPEYILTKKCFCSAHNWEQKWGYADL